MNPRPDAARPFLGGPLSAVALVLAVFTEAVGYGMVAPTLPFMARQVGADEGRIGLLVGLYAAVGLFVALPLGALANRFGRRALILLGHACLAIASVGFVFAPTFGWLVTARAIQGLGATGIWVGALTLAADLSEDAAMGRSLAWITGAWSLGFIVGPALGGVGTLATPFILYGSLSGAAFVVAAAGLPAIGRGAPRATFAGILRVFRRRPVLASGAATFSLAFFFGTIEAFVPFLLADPAGGGAPGSRTVIGLLFMVAGLPSVLLPAVTGRLADRFGDGRVVVAGLVFAAAYSFAFLPLFARVPHVPLFLLLGCVEVLVYTPAVALLHRGMASADRIFASGSHSYAFSAGFFLGPSISGVLFRFGGYRTMFVLLGVVSIVAAAIVARASAAVAARRPLAGGPAAY